MSVSLLGPCRTHTQRNIQAEDIKWKTALANACLFVALSPYGREQQQVLQRIHSQERSHLGEMPAYDPDRDVVHIVTANDHRQLVGLARLQQE